MYAIDYINTIHVRSSKFETNAKSCEILIMNWVVRWFSFLILSSVLTRSIAQVPAQIVSHLEWVRPSADGTHFIGTKSGERIILWGVNYDHDGAGRLLEDYWDAEWASVVEDFREIRALGANCVRVHLQLAKFMET